VTWRPAALVLALALAASGAARAGDATYTNWRGLALSGYDAVAYFVDGRPIEGSSEHALEWRDATWRFASAENLARFRADPERYAPQYGGYCAWAVSQGYTASADPEAWRIVDGKLYVNYDADVQREWETDVPGHIARANANWPKLRDR
jgi:YHS domain-containing protein